MAGVSTHKFVSRGAEAGRRLGCPVMATVGLLRGKWKVQALWHLSRGPLRFGELREHLPGVSEKVLVSQLRELETDCVVRRKADGGISPRVTYSLSPAGKRLVPLLEDLCRWGSAHFGIEPSLPTTGDRARRAR